MQIHLRTGDFQFQRRDPAQAVTHGWNARGNHSRIGNDHDLRLQRIAILREEISKVGAADFLFALDDEM